MTQTNFTELRERLATDITLFSHDRAALLELVDMKIAPAADGEIRRAAIEECAALMRRWADDAGDFKDDPKCVILRNTCRNAATAISNLAKGQS